MTFKLSMEPVKVPRGFSGDVRLRTFLLDELELGLDGVSRDIVTRLKGQTKSFTGTTRRGWKASEAIKRPGREFFQITFFNDAPPVSRTAGITAAIQEGPERAAFIVPPPIRSGRVESGRQLVDWVEQNLLIETSKKRKTFQGAVESAARAVAHSIRASGLPSASNVNRQGNFARAIQRSLPDVERAVSAAVAEALRSYAEVR